MIILNSCVVGEVKYNRPGAAGHMGDGFLVVPIYLALDSIMDTD